MNTLKKNIKYLSLFSGIGAFETALRNLSIPFDLVGFSEIDKYAIRSYCMVNDIPIEKNLGDIKLIDTSILPNDIDLITYGFPCQDISLAGKQKGFEENGELTRSGLFFEALRIIKDTQPKVAIAENVKNLVSKRFKNEFEIVLHSLEEAGYNNYWKILNSKDFGIPQQRERVFIVSIRKDLDNHIFEFPQPFELKLKLKDMLESEVDEKYYLSEKMINGFLKHNQKHKEKGTGFIWQTRDINGVASTLRANGALAPTDNTINVCQIGNFLNAKNPTAGRVYDSEGLSPSLRATTGGYNQPCIKVQEREREREREFIMIPEKTKKGYKEAYEGDGVYINRPHQKRGCVQKGMIQTLKTSGCDVGVVTENLRIRKLTPRECFRLMGFKDSDFDKIKGISNTQLYKQAGNSIVVDVAEELLCMLFDEENQLFM